MLRRLIIAGAMLTALSAPSLAADWYVVKSTAGPAASANSDANYDPCYVVDRMAGASEEQLKGPFATQRAGLEAMADTAACDSTPKDS